MKRKLVLILALVAAVGFGFGWITEDLCCLGGSYADDPNTPGIAAEFAIPSHTQAAPRAVLMTVAVETAAFDDGHIGTFHVVPAEQSSGLSSLQNPRRC